MPKYVNAFEVAKKNLGRAITDNGTLGFQVVDITDQHIVEDESETIVTLYQIYCKHGVNADLPNGPYFVDRKFQS